MPRRVAGAALVGLAVLVSSCGISLQSLPKIGGVSGPTYEVTATFANVVNLPANAEVRVGAFSVGYVSSIGLKDFQAVVTMKIKNSTKLPAGTTATVAFDTPLGEDFIQLTAPTVTTAASYLKNGAAIPEQDTVTAPSVEKAFGALGALLNGGGINQLQTIISQTNLALNGNQSKIRNLVQVLNETVTSFAQNTPSIDAALDSIAALTKTLNQNSGTITQGIASLGPAVSLLSSQNQSLDDLVSQLDNLSTVSNDIITASSSGTIDTVDQLFPLLTQLVNVKGQIAPALTAINELETNTPRAVPGNYLQLNIDATVEVPPVPSDALPLDKVTVDPPEQGESYADTAIATILEGGLP